jgi:hypothetical protein
MPEYTASFSKRGAYSFGQGAIMDLVSATKKFLDGGEPTIEIRLKHGHRVEMNDAEAILTDAFVRNGVLQGIEISAWPRGSRISISLGQRGLFSVVDVTIAGSRDKCTAARAEIEPILDASRLWYAPFYERWSLSILPWVVVGLLLSEMISRWPISKDAPIWVSLIAFLAVLVLAVAVFNLFGRRMFPQVVFEIGRSNEVGERARYWRNAVGIGFILAIVAGIAASLIYDRLK